MTYRNLYIIGLVLTAYAIFTIKYSVTGGAILSGIVAVFALLGAIGLFLKKAWSRFFILIFTILIVPWWIYSTIWIIVKKGWPYYPTTYESVLGLLPGILLCLFSIFSSWASYKQFSGKKKSVT
jgi:hypothetical protein